MSDSTPRQYDADDLVVLEGLAAVRKRPGMYIGSTDGRGLTHLVAELIDNAVDEALAGHASHITVRFGADGSVEVADDGRGIPVGANRQTGLSGVEMVFTRLHAGGKFGGGGYGTAGGLHGVGASVVNALAVRLDVAVRREGRRHLVSFQRGEPGVFDGDGPTATFTPAPGLRDGGPAEGSGTTVRFWPDHQVFTPDAAVDVEAVVERARQTAYLVDGVAVSVQRADGSETRFDGDGLEAFLAELADGREVGPAISVSGSGVFNERVVDVQGHATEVERTCEVQVALQWTAASEPKVRSFVNVVGTPGGGTHVAGFDRALTRVVNEALRTHRKRRDSDGSVIKDDVQEGLTAIVSVAVPEPQFEGQTKSVLGTAGVATVVYEVLAGALRRRWRTDGSGKPPRSDLPVLDKIVEAAKVRHELKARRETLRRKNALTASSLPSKLADCRSRDVDRTELLIVEGDSAGGTAKGARDAEFQAVLPLRGKILNVYKATEARMLANRECADLISALGAGAGKGFDMDRLRYGRVVILTDADVDGAHIRILVLSLLFRYMRPLLTAGRVCSAVPPLHRLDTSDARGRDRRFLYAYTDQERHRIAADEAAAGRRIVESQRYKGLGEMDVDQLAETTLDVDARKLRRVTVADAAAADDVFELLMGGEVGPRRDFIAANALAVTPDRIDA